MDEELKDALDYDQEGDETENDIKNMKAIMQSISYLDSHLNVQVINGPADVPKQVLKIQRIKLLGKGAQGAAHLCKLDGRDGEFVDKSVSVDDSAGKIVHVQL